MSDESDQPCEVIRDAKRYGDSVHIDLLYPKLKTNPVKAIVVGLVDVRAADDIRIEYDYTRDGWKISMLRRDNPCLPCDEDECTMEEVAFIPAWLEGR